MFCDAVCKQRAYRRRRAGLAEWEWSVNDALRGRVPLAGETRSESQWRAERDELYAIRLALRLRPGGGTVVIDGREVTVIDPILGAP